MHTCCLLSRQDTSELNNDSFRNICDLLYNPYDTELLHFIFIVFFFSKLYHVWENTKCECDLIMPVVLCGCDTRCLAVRDGCRIRDF